MDTLNSQFYQDCKPNSSELLKIDNHTYTIKNFFSNFESSKKFLTQLNKWQCDCYDFTTKSGKESVLPNLCGMYLYDKSCLKKHIKNFNLFSININFLFFNQIKKFDKLQSSNGTFDMPHHDSIYNLNQQKTFVCLINLNDYDISTNFWSFNDNQIMEDDSYLIFIEKMNQNYKLSKKNPKMPENVSLVKRITYEPNQALIYNASFLHNADIKENHSQSSPRTTLRLFFSCDDIKIFSFEWN